MFDVLNLFRLEAFEVQRASRLPRKTIYQIFLKNSLITDVIYELEVGFSGSMWETAEGLFKGSYLDSNGEKRYFVIFF